MLFGAIKVLWKDNVSTKYVADCSNFSSVLKAKRITPSLLKRLLGEYDLSRVKAVQWGGNNEEEAIKALILPSNRKNSQRNWDLVSFLLWNLWCIS